MSIRTVVKGLLLRSLELVTRRRVVLLPLEARDDTSMLSVVAAYRVADGVLSARVCHDRGGDLALGFVPYAERKPAGMMSLGSIHCEPESCRVDITVRQNEVIVDGRSFRIGLQSRRFGIDWQLTDPDGKTLKRHTSHYLSAPGATAGSEYFQGDEYVDYEVESLGEGPQILKLLSRFGCSGPVLEVGCATGVTTEFLKKAGVEVLGVEISEWAVDQARRRVGDAGVVCADVCSGEFPADLLARAPFGTLVLWAVFEHFPDPFEALRRLTPLVAHGGALLIHTTNYDSLSRRVFGEDWEGHFDTTHYGVSRVSRNSLREELPAIGWQIQHLKTSIVWDGSLDPTHATLRELHGVDARFRALLDERDLGDFITIVAKRCES